MLSSAVKTDAQVYTVPPVLFRYRGMGQLLGSLEYRQLFYLQRSPTIPTIIGTLLSCTLVAYGFSGFKMAGQGLLFATLMTMMVPFRKWCPCLSYLKIRLDQLL
jgi:ABC-type glycerol-3-phosphate transport system permease component